MRFSYNQTNKTKIITTIAFAYLIALLAGGSMLFFYSSFMPLVIGGAAASLVLLSYWFRKPVWAFYAALFFVFLPSGLLPSNVHSLANRSLTIMAFVLFIVTLIIGRLKLRWTLPAYIFLGFLLWSIATFFWIENFGQGLIILQTYFLRLILFLFLIPNLIRDRDGVNGLMKVLALLGWILMIIAIFSVITGGYSTEERLKIFGMNENEQGIVALITMIGVLWQAMYAKRFKIIQKLLAGIYIGLTIFIVASSGSRGSAISLFITLFCFLLWKPTRLWGIIGISMLAVGAMVAPFIFSTTVERFLVRERWDTLLGGREALWQAASILIKNHTWQGVGIGNAPYAMLAVLQYYRSTIGLDSAAVHNPLLTIWVETGIIGLLLYGGVLISATALFFQQYILSIKRGQKSLLPYFAMITSLAMGYFPSWIKGGGMETGFSYFLVLALLILPSHLKDKNQEQEKVGFVMPGGSETSIP
jgi:putative inorganic carbon (HCO3(-)) transporter